MPEIKKPKRVFLVDVKRLNAKTIGPRKVYTKIPDDVKAKILADSRITQKECEMLCMYNVIPEWFKE